MQQTTLIFISFLFLGGNRAKCYLNRTDMQKMVPTLSEGKTKTTDLTFSGAGINLRENVSTFLVKTNLPSVNIDLF